MTGGLQTRECWQALEVENSRPTAKKKTQPHFYSAMELNLPTIPMSMETDSFLKPTKKNAPGQHLAFGFVKHRSEIALGHITLGLLTCRIVGLPFAAKFVLICYGSNSKWTKPHGENWKDYWKQDVFKFTKRFEGNLCLSYYTDHPCVVYVVRMTCKSSLHETNNNEAKKIITAYPPFIYTNLLK